jgi:hypothetical protein
MDVLEKRRGDEVLAALERAESDIITAIIKMLEHFEDVEFRWVQGHQDDDDDTPLSERPHEVRLNIACDAAAKECLTNYIYPKKTPKTSGGCERNVVLWKQYGDKRYEGTDSICMSGEGNA